MSAANSVKCDTCSTSFAIYPSDKHLQSFFVTTTAGEDETSEGNRGNSNDYVPSGNSSSRSNRRIFSEKHYRGPTMHILEFLGLRK